MEKIKIGIVEDELLIAENIIVTLLDLGYDVTEPATNYTAALAMIEEEQPDLLLLDIVLSGHKDGIELAQTIKTTYNLPFIFLTSNADQATIDRAKALNPPSYLVKPFNRNDLFAAIELAAHNHKTNVEPQTPAVQNQDKRLKDTLFVKQSSMFFKVKYDSICYLNSDHVYVDIHTAESKFTDRKSLSDYEAILPSSQFIRIHRSYLVNIDFIEAICPTTVLVNGQELPVARKYKDDLMALVEGR